MTAFAVGEDYYKHEVTLACLDEKIDVTLEEKTKLVINELRNEIQN